MSINLIISALLYSCTYIDINFVVPITIPSQPACSINSLIDFAFLVRSCRLKLKTSCFANVNKNRSEAQRKLKFKFKFNLTLTFHFILNEKK